MKRIKFIKRWLFFCLLIFICFFSACSGGEFQQTLSSGWENMINSVDQAVLNSAAKATKVAEIAEKTITAMAGDTEIRPKILMTSTSLMISGENIPTATSSLVSLQLISSPENTSAPVEPTATFTEAIAIEPTETMIPTETSAPVEPTATFTETMTIEPSETMISTETSAPMEPTATFTETMTIEPTETLLPTATSAPEEPTATFTETMTIEPTKTLLPTATSAPVEPTVTFTEAIAIEPTETMISTETSAPEKPTATFTETMTIEMTETPLPIQTVPTVKLTPISTTLKTMEVADSTPLSIEIPLIAEATIVSSTTRTAELSEPAFRSEMTETPIPVVEIEMIPQTNQISSFVVTNTPAPTVTTSPFTPEIEVESGISGKHKDEIPTVEIIPIISPTATTIVQIEIETIPITPQNSESETEIGTGFSDFQRITIKPVSEYDETFLRKIPPAMRIGEKTELGFVTGILPSNSSERYLIPAEDGQKLSIHIESRENHRSLLSISGSETGKIYQNALISPVDWETEVPVAQEYLIEIRSENDPVEFVVIISLQD